MTVSDTRMSAQSLIRQRRAAAARTLLTLHQAGQLAEPERWTWDVLDALPVWCMQDEQSRNQLQLLCGALVLAPELRLWIDRELILAAHLLIGKPKFDDIVAKADLTPVPVNTKIASRFTSASSREDLTDSVRSVLLRAGASVMKASLRADLPVDTLASLLGDTAGNVTFELACKLLVQAEQLQQQSTDTSNEPRQAVADIESQSPPVPGAQQSQSNQHSRVSV